MQNSFKNMGIILQGPWDQEMLARLNGVMRDLSAFMGMGKFRSVFNNTRIRFIKSERLKNMGIRSFAPPPPISTIIRADVVLVNTQSEYTIVHELGHVWDYRTKFQLSRRLMQELGTWTENAATLKFEWRPFPTPEAYPGTPKEHENANIIEKPAHIPYAATQGGGGGLNRIATLLTKPGMEDWAESLACLIYPDHYPSYNRCALKPGGIRERFIRKQIIDR